MSWRDQWRRSAPAGECEQQAALHTLGLGRDAHADQIKGRYRQLSAQWHPDRHTGAVAKAAAEAEFKRIGEAFACLQGRLPVGHEMVTVVAPHEMAPWWHYTRYPPWSFSRGPPYAPRGFWCAQQAATRAIPACVRSDQRSRPVRRCAMAGLAAAALLYDAANPSIGERRLQRLLDWEASEEARRMAAREVEFGQANEMSRAARSYMLTSFESEVARKVAAGSREAR